MYRVKIKENYPISKKQQIVNAVIKDIEKGIFPKEKQLPSYGGLIYNNYMISLFRKSFLIIGILLTNLYSFAFIQVGKLKVQSAPNPFGIQVFKPDFSWQWQSERRNSSQVAYQILVASSQEMLQLNEADVWNSGKVYTDKQNYIAYLGKKLKSGKTYFWKVRIWDNYREISSWSEIALFTMGILFPSEWKAQWITYDISKATAQPIFRRAFVLNKVIKYAVIHIAGLGYYELYLNGKKIGDHVLDPGQTNYDDYALYATYNVTDYLKNNINVVGVMLGDGWYNQNKVWGPNGLTYGNPLLICQLVIEFTDGTQTKILSDQNWKWNNGPIIKSNVYAGEIYNAQKEIKNWNSKIQSNLNWMPVMISKNHPPKLIAQNLPPIKRMKELTPKKIYQVKKDTYIFDFGQNFAGWTRLSIDAPPGTIITIKTAEEVDADGKLDPASTGVFVTKVVQTDQYTCRGGGEEIWEPRFTYHGFRYAEVSGLTKVPDKNLLLGIVVHSSVTIDGSFICSNEQMNHLHQLAIWTLISNLYSIPTDCPTREKCGWLGDANVMTQMSIYNFGMENFYLKYLYDIRSSSQVDGKALFYRTWDKHEVVEKPKGIPYMIAPGKRRSGIATPDWGTATVQIPWNLYLFYGNETILKEFYSDMKKWVSYLDSLSENHIVNCGLGDWCPPGRVVPLEPPVSFTSTAFYYIDLKIMYRTAMKLGLDEDARKFKQNMEKVRKAFLNRFYDPEKKTFGGQTANALALYMEIVPQEDEYDVSNKISVLSKDSLNGFINTGIFGLSRIFKALSEYGNEATAYSILTKKGYNSFEYMWSEYGATTLWEILPVDSFYLKKGDKGQERSHNHPMQGGYDMWFYESVLGIRPDESAPGFKKIIIEPHMFDQLVWAMGDYQSPYGNIKSSWKRDGDNFFLNVTIPPNTSANIYLPASSAGGITESGKFISEVKNVHFVKSQKGRMIYEIGSGSYSFSVKLN